MPYAQTPFMMPLTTKNETIEISITMMPTSRPCPAAGSDTNRLITRGSINPNTPATTIPTNNPIPPESDEPLDFVQIIPARKPNTPISNAAASVRRYSRANTFLIFSHRIVSNLRSLTDTATDHSDTSCAPLNASGTRYRRATVAVISFLKIPNNAVQD